MFENFVTSQGFEASRYIASWTLAGGSLKYWYEREAFTDWLIGLGLSIDERRRIRDLATNGKLEFQENAMKYISESELLK